MGKYPSSDHLVHLSWAQAISKVLAKAPPVIFSQGNAMADCSSTWGRGGLGELRLESCNTKHGRQQKGVAEISMVPEDGTGRLDFKRIAHLGRAQIRIYSVPGRRLLFESLVGLQPLPSRRVSYRPRESDRSSRFAAPTDSFIAIQNPGPRVPRTAPMRPGRSDALTGIGPPFEVRLSECGVAWSGVRTFLGRECISS